MVVGVLGPCSSVGTSCSGQQSPHVSLVGPCLRRPVTVYGLGRTSMTLQTSTRTTVPVLCSSTAGTSSKSFAPSTCLRRHTSDLTRSGSCCAYRQHLLGAGLTRASVSATTTAPRKGAGYVHVCCSNGSGNGDEPSNRRNPNRSWQPWGWIQQMTSNMKLQTPLRILFNVVVLYVLMRIWPIGGRSGLGGEPDHVVVQVPFSEFVRRIKQDEVQSVSVDGLQLNFALRPTSPLLAARPEGSDAAKITFYTVRPADYGVPYEILESHGVTFSAVDRKSNRLMSILVYALYVGLLLSALNRLPIKLPNQKGTGRKHKGGSSESGSSSSPVMFADVAGVDEAKEELAEIVEYLRAPERFSKLGARPPSGVLLVGPPGTGKTLLARAVAGEADVPFFSISASEFVELYVGMGAMRVRELFASARKEAPAIVFIDEIDAVAKGRDMRLRSVGNDEREQTLNQLLTELDGFDSDKDNVVICIAATNRPDVLDPALLRPGRFDRRVSVERPDRIGREQILKVHLKRRGLPLAGNVSVTDIASGTTGFTGADLANLVNEAALLAGRRSKAEVGHEEFDMAIMRAIAGIEKKRSILQGVEKGTVAKHEVGHAIVGTAVSRLLPVQTSAVEKLSIIPRSGGALGFTYMPPKTEDRALMFDSEIRGQLAMLMGGRAAEHLTCDAVSTGAVDDIKRATDMAYRAVSEFGLSGSVGPVNISVLAAGGADDALLLKDGGSMSRLVEAEVKALLEGALTCAMDCVVTNNTLHDGLSNVLHVNERVEGEELQKWLGNVVVPDSLRQFVLYGKVPDRNTLDLQPMVARAMEATMSPLTSGQLGDGGGGAGLPPPAPA